MRYYTVTNLITLPSGGGGGGSGAGTNVNYFYLLPAFAPGAGSLPGGFLFAWNASPPAGTFNGAGAGGMGTNIGSAQSATPSITGTYYIGGMQFISAPVKAQTVGGLVDIGFAFNSQTSSNALVCIGLLTPAGALRSALLTLASYSWLMTSTDAEYTAWHTGIGLTSQAATAGDRLVVEIGVYWNFAGTMNAFYAGGSVPIVANGVLTTNAAAFVNFQTAVQMQ